MLSAPLPRGARRLLMFALCGLSLTVPAAALGHGDEPAGHSHGASTSQAAPADAQPALAPSPTATGAAAKLMESPDANASTRGEIEPDGLADEPVIPGLQWAVDFQVAPNGDVYVANQDGGLYRYELAAGSTTAHPRYSLEGQLIHRFQTTRQNDRGLVGFTLDSSFGSGNRYLYALMTRGTTDFVDDRPNPAVNNPNGIRRTAIVVRIDVPVSGEATAADIKTILGKDAPADPDSTCKPFTKTQGAVNGESDAAPNGVAVRTHPDSPDGSKIPYFTEANVYPDGNLNTRADGAYDCIPSDGDTHGLGGIISAPDGSLMLSVGDSNPWQLRQGAALRTQNLESPLGKVLRVNRDGKGFANSPFCPTETDTSRICTKIWAIGLRNAFRIAALAPDAGTRGLPAIAVGDVGDYSMERLTITHPGDNLGWPCWQGTYWYYWFASPEPGTAPKSAWGGPSLLPTDGVNGAHTSCERLTLNNDGRGQAVQPSPGITFPTIEYQHEQQLGYDSAAIVAGPQLVARAGADPDVALPSAWDGSLLFGDYVRGWVHRVSPDPSDPTNTQRDSGLRVPRDENRGPTVRTDPIPSANLDPLLDRIADAPAPLADGSAPWYRLTLREGPDGTLWYMRLGDKSRGAGIFRLRHRTALAARIDQLDFACTRTAVGTAGSFSLAADDAGPGATYAWDLDGDGVGDPGRTGQTTTITAAQLESVSPVVRLFTAAGSKKAASACYLGRGLAPQLTIAPLPDGGHVVLGQPVVVSATRPADDPSRASVPDEGLRWAATTVHGSKHEHPLGARLGPFETVDGVQKMQFTVVPDSSHELGSYSRVRIFSLDSDANAATQTVRLLPKPVDVTLRSSPAGASIVIPRDGFSSTVAAAPGVVNIAAGYIATIVAAPSFVDNAGRTQSFKRWSDGPTDRSREWRIPNDGGDAPLAEYDTSPLPTTPEPTSPTTPEPTSPTTPEPTSPTTPEPTGPTAPADPDPPADPDAKTPDASPPGDAAPPNRAPNVTGPGPSILPPIPLTALELAQAPLSLTLSGANKPRARILATFKLARGRDESGLEVKVAVRSPDCRWWSFRHRQLAGSKVTRHGARAVKATRRACRVPPSWKLVRSTWRGSAAKATIALGGRLPSGRYAVRLRVQRGTTVLAQRVRALVIR